MNSFNRLQLAALVTISLLWVTGCASVSTSQTETDDAYFNSSDIRKEKEAATIAALKKATEEANASPSGSNDEYVNPNFKASGKSGSNRNTSSNNYSTNSYSSNYSSPYYSGYYSGGYSWMPGPYNYGSSFSMCYPLWYGSGWGSSLILGTRPYNPWMMNSGFGMGYGMSYGMGYGMGYGNSFYYNSYDPFYSPAFGYYGYNPFASWYYSPYSSYYNPYYSGNYYNPVYNNEPSSNSGLVKTNLPISGMTGGDVNATGGRLGTPVRGGRMNTDNQQPGGQPVVNNPNPDTHNGRPNSSIFRQESNSNQGQVVTPPPVNNNPDHHSGNNSGFWRNDNNNNDFFRNQNTGSGGGHSSGGFGTGNTSGGGNHGGAQMTGGRKR